MLAVTPSLTNHVFVKKPKEKGGGLMSPESEVHAWTIHVLIFTTNTIFLKKPRSELFKFEVVTAVTMRDPSF
jgi:hypothetical protein